MPTTGNVEERIIEMRIDHEKFEAGAKKTISILEKLDEGLHSLGENNSSGFDSITDSLDKVTNKISVFGTIGDQVIRTMTNKVMDLVGQVRNLYKELGSGQMSAGWSKYETKTQSVQTIMAATSNEIGKRFKDEAEQMEYVNAQLNRLNTYTDETSYNLVDMTDNIGKFTSAGVDLDTAVTAMMGISNWAALSGATMAETSRAYYNLSQALSVGSVKAIDWKSIENANMATLEFKQTALETAVSLGQLKKIGKNTYKTLDTYTKDSKGKKKKKEGKIVTAEAFRDSLKEDWFTSEVLLKTLEQYGGFTEKILETKEALGLEIFEIKNLMEAYEKGGEKGEEYQEVLKELGLTSDKAKTYLKDLTDDSYELGRKAFFAAQEAKTLTEAINAVKDATSTGFMNIFEKMFGDYEEAKELWSDVAEQLYAYFVEPINKLNRIFQFVFGEGFESEEEMAEAAADAAAEVDTLGEYLESAGFNMEQFEKAFSEVDDFTLKNLIEEYGSVEEAINQGAISAEFFKKIIEQMVKDNPWHSWQLTGKHGNKVEISYGSEKTEGELKTIYDLLYHTDAVLDRIKKKSEDTGEVVDGVVNRISGRVLLKESIINILQFIIDVRDAIVEVKDEVFGITEKGTANKIYDILKRFHDFTESIQLTGEKGESFRETIRGIFDTFLSVINVITNVVDILFRVGSTVISIATNSGILQAILTALLLVVEGIIAPIRAVVNYFRLLNEARKEKGEDGWIDKLVNAFSTLGGYITSAAEKFKEFMSGEKVMNFFLMVIFLIVAGLEKIVSFTVSLFGRIKSLVKLIKVGYMKNGLAGVFSVLSIHYKKLIKDHPTLFKIFTFIENVISKITSIVSSGYSAISKWFSSIDLSKFTKYLPTLESIQKLIKDFKDAFHGDFNGIREWWSGIVKKVQDSLESIKIAFANLNIKELIKTFFNNIIEGFKNNTFISELITSLKERFGGIIEKIKNTFTKIFGDFSFDSEKLKKLFETLKTLMPLFVGGGLILMIRQIRRAFEEIEGVAWMIEKKQFMNGLKKVSNMVVKLAISLVLVAVALKVVSTIPSDKILDSLLTLVAILSALVRAAITINNVPNVAGKKNAKKVKGLIALAVSVLLAAVALKIISTIDTAKLLTSWLALTALLIDLIIFTNLAGNVKNKGLGKLIGVAISLAMIIGVIWLLAIMPIEDFLKGWMMLNALFVSIIGFTLFAGNVKRKGLGELWKIAISLLIIVKVLEKLSKFDFGTFLKSWIMLKFILSSIATFTRRSRSIQGKGLGGLISVVISIWVLTGILKKLGSLSLGSLLKGWLGIELILYSIASFTKRISKLKKVGDKAFVSNGLKGKGLGGLFTVVITVIALAAVLKNLSSLSLGGILKGWLGIELIILSITGFIKRVSKTEGLKGKGILSLIVIALSVGALAEVLIRLSAYDFTAILKGWSGIALIMRTIRNFVKQTSGAQFNLKSMLMLLEVAFVVVVIMQVLIRLSKIKAKRLVGPVAALMTCLLTIANTIKIISKASKNLYSSGIVALVVGVLAFVAIAQVLIKLTEYDFTGAVEPILLAILTLYAITGAIALMGKVGPGVMAKGVAALAIIAVGITLIIGAVIGIGIGIVNMANTLADKLKSFIDKLKPFIKAVDGLTDANEEAMKRFARIMKSILEASFWGAIASVLASVMTGLDLAGKLKSFMDNMKPFLDGVLVCINPLYLLAVSMLEKIMLALVGATFWGAIASIFALVISGSNLATNLTNFINNLEPFLTEVAKLTDDDKTNVERLEAIMLAITGAEFWGVLASILQYMISNESLPNTLTTFIQNLWPFFDEVVKIKPIYTMRVKTFAATMKAIAEAEFWGLLSTILNALGNWFGGSNQVAVKLSTFIKDLQPFFESVLTITPEHLAAVQLFTEVMKGVAATEFWKFVAEFLDGFSSFLGNKMNGGTNTDGATEALKDDMESMGDVAEGAADFTDKMSAIGNLGQKLSDFITDLKPFLEATKEITEEDVNGVSNFGSIMQTIAMSEMWTSLADLLNKIVNSKLVLNLGEGTGTFFERAGELVDALGPFLKHLKNDTTIGSKTVTRVQRFGEIIKALAIGDIWVSFADMIDAITNPKLKTSFERTETGWMETETAPLQTFGERLNALATDLVPFLNTIRGNVSEDDKTAAQNLGEVLKSLAVGEFWGKISEILGGLDGNIGAKLKAFGNGFAPFMEKVRTIQSDDTSKLETFSSVMQKITELSFWSAISQWIQDIFNTDIVEFATHMSEFAEALGPFIAQFQSMTTEQISNMDDFFSIIDWAGAGNVGVMERMGQDLLHFNEQLKMIDSEKVNSVVSSITNFLYALSAFNAIEYDETRFETLGTNIITSIATGLETGENTLKDRAKNVIHDAIVAGGNDNIVTASAETIGRHITSGVARGIYDSMDRVTRAARLMAIAAKNAVANALGIHSPSRVFAALAEYIPEGVALGIEKNTHVATDSVTILGTGIITAMQMAMARVATVADERFEFSPVITPVVDMTNIDTAVGNAGSMFGTVSSTMRGSIQVAADNAQLLASVANNSSSSSILDEMRSLSDHLDELGDAVASMQIVLDTGVLVGATSHQMDNAFGTMQARRGRGN